MHPFQVMAEPIRRRIVEVLASGEHPSGMVTAVIVDEFSVTRAAAARHLRILLDEGWVDRRPDWNERLYRLNPHALDQLDREMACLHRLWALRIGTISRNDPMPAPAERRVGEAKGRRGVRARADLWRHLYTEHGLS